ncbi:hypothetical protein L596_009664 [Steinernema carpocapsae]|uniref:Uncharacterized protein n=1 Tax=Steinernema carpocapsae TaxID=34508 RepID=A0A4U5PGB0_STECR|nr:hypothetical protein L596_009664 [Steinernema carpocapsae]
MIVFAVLQIASIYAASIIVSVVFCSKEKEPPKPPEKTSTQPRPPSTPSPSEEPSTTVSKKRSNQGKPPPTEVGSNYQMPSLSGTLRIGSDDKKSGRPR